MPSINMIAARRAEQLRLARVTRILAGSLAGVVFFGLAANLYMGGVALQVHSEIRAVDRELARLAPILAQIGEIERERNELAPKLDLLRTARRDTNRWSNILRGFQQGVPKGAWLTAVAPEGVPTEPAAGVRLTGQTLSQKLVGETMLRLNTQPHYDTITLQYSQESMQGLNKTVQFELLAKLTPTEDGKKDDQAEPQAK